MNGALVDEEHARVSAYDHGLTVGDGVFETLKVIDGQAFAVTRHLRRLERSAAGLGLAPPDLDAVRLAVAETLAANAPTSRARMRVTYTGGVSPLGSDRGTCGGTLIVALAPLLDWPPTAAVVTVPWIRNERSAVAGLKTTSYADNVVALSFARARQASEAIFANSTGELCEGSGSNVFLAVGDERLVTPPLASGCLAGVTRELLLEWLPPDRVEEQRVPLAALAQATEAFLTSSTRDVLPIRAVDGVPLPAAPGPLSSYAMEVFASRAAADPDP